MASGGSSFIATPVAVSAGHSSPVRAMKSAGMKKSSASELLDQIRQLEVEGQKLRHSNLINLGKDIEESWSDMFEIRFKTLSSDCSMTGIITVFYKSALFCFIEILNIYNFL